MPDRIDDKPATKYLRVGLDRCSEVRGTIAPHSHIPISPRGPGVSVPIRLHRGQGIRFNAPAHDPSIASRSRLLARAAGTSLVAIHRRHLQSCFQACTSSWMDRGPGSCSLGIDRPADKRL